MSSDQSGFWDVQDRLRELSAQGDPLERLARTVDFELFRAELNAALGTRDRGKGGRPAFDAVLKFRMLVLQALHGLSRAQTEYLAAYRLSWTPPKTCLICAAGLIHFSCHGTEWTNGEAAWVLRSVGSSSGSVGQGR
jgi:hypothetical protein